MIFASTDDFRAVECYFSIKSRRIYCFFCVSSLTTDETRCAKTVRRKHFRLKVADLVHDYRTGYA